MGKIPVRERRFILNCLDGIKKNAPASIGVITLKYGQDFHFLYAGELIAGFVRISRTEPDAEMVERYKKVASSPVVNYEVWVPDDRMIGKYRTFIFTKGAFKETFPKIFLAEDSRPGHAGKRRPRGGFVYFILNLEKNIVKIGRSNSAGRRMYELRSHNADRLELLHAIKSDNAFEVERTIHSHFKDIRVYGEWFSLTPELKAFIDGAKDHAD